MRIATTIASLLLLSPAWGADGNAPSAPAALPRSIIAPEEAIAVAVNNLAPTAGGVRLANPRHVADFSASGVDFTPRRGGPAWHWHLVSIVCADELDLAVAREFMKMKKKSAMTLKDFETCYKALNNKPERELQLQLLMETTRFFHKLAHVPLLGFVIKPTQLAAKMLGVEYIMEFFMEGYRSFKSVKDAEPFMVAIEERERAYLNKLLP